MTVTVNRHSLMRAMIWENGCTLSVAMEDGLPQPTLQDRQVLPCKKEARQVPRRQPLVSMARALQRVLRLFDSKEKLILTEDE